MNELDIERRIKKLEEEIDKIAAEQSQTNLFIKELRSELFGNDDFKREGLIETLKTIESLLKYFRNTKVIGAFLIAYLLPFIYFTFKIIEWLKSLP